MPRPLDAHPAGCALLGGAAACDCAAAAPGLRDTEIEVRARGMAVWQQKATREGRWAARRGLDELLAWARSRGPSTLVAELLRVGIVLRVQAECPDDADAAQSMIAAYAELAELDGDPVRLGEATVLQAYHVAVYHHGDSALPDAAAALALLSDVSGPRPGQDHARWCGSLARALNILVLVLLRLGAHEIADQVSQRATAVADPGMGPMDRLVHRLNRIRLQLSWALRLERVGRDAPAASRFLAAAQSACTAERLWQAVRERSADGTLPPARDSAVIGAAYALQHPGPEHLDDLARLAALAYLPDDRVVLAIATARCLTPVGRAAEAVAVLNPLRIELSARCATVSPLTLALHRESARVESAVRGGLPRSAAVDRYARALEAELWQLREARLIALRSHSDHHRLSREHGAATAQALQDPLTGLPNRRALELRLNQETAAPTSQPCAVALIDLDRFKDVNDARSHAAGDAVLRAVAGCLRTTLRGHDLVARYGGDEFVVVMPSTPLPVARAALLRAAEAVAALPGDVAAGVTMSAGVVRAPLDGDPAAALAGADAAMYRAKRAGGNTVVIGATPTVGIPAGRAATDRRVMSSAHSGPLPLTAP